MPTLAELADIAGAELRGDGTISVEGVATLADASSTHIAFLANAQYKSQLLDTEAAAVILSPSDADACPTACLVAKNPYASYALVASVFAPTTASGEIHPSAVIAPTAKLHMGVTVDAGCVVGDGVSIGANTHLYPNVVLYNGVEVGERCIVHAGVVIGADGFGFAPDDGCFTKVPQLGGVVIGDDVEVGANSTIDCGALADTVIGNGVKIDNNVQIGHNVRIGDHTVVAAMVGIAGSATIGSGCMIGGQVGIAGHIEVADGVMLTGRTMVTKGLPEPGVYSSGIPVDTNSNWRRNVARFRNLDVLARKVKSLEMELKRLQQLDGGDSDA